MGVTNPESMGLGGGSLIVFYNATTKKADAIDAREMAPSGATKDMYNDNPESSSTGTLSIGVPGQLAGLWEIHQRYGHLSWKELFPGSIDLAKNGFSVGKHLADALKEKENIIKGNKSLR